MKITLIGAGNVSMQLGRAFRQAGHTIAQVYARRPSEARRAARALNCRSTSLPERVDPEVDVTVIAVSDEAIASMAAVLPSGKSLVVHTSGPTPLRVLGRFPNRGVLYPLASMVRGQKIDFSKVPFCIEAGSRSSERAIARLARSLGAQVHHLDSGQRATAHLAAVFANNFPNYLFTVADRILQEKNISFDLLRPLIHQTMDKVQRLHPADVQTGPAARGDEQVIRRHLKLLRDPALRKIYALLTDGIRKSK